MAWLVTPNVKGTAIYPKFTRELKPEKEGTARCGSCWDVSQTPSQFYLQGTQALLIGAVINTHLVWCEKSVSLLQLLHYSLPTTAICSWVRPPEDFLDFMLGLRSPFCLEGASQLARGFQVFRPSEKIRSSTQLLAWLPSLDEGTQ